MDVKETFEAARDSLTVRRVFGEPYERNGVTVIPTASVRAGSEEATATSPTARPAVAAASGCEHGRSVPT